MTTTIQKQDPQAIDLQRPAGNADVMASLVVRAAEQLQRASLGRIDPARVLRLALLTKMAARKNSALLRCTSGSLLWSFLDAARCGLEWDGVEGALVPFKDECRFIPMYQGLIRVATSSGTIKKISAVCVYRADEFSVLRGTEERIHHVPSFIAEQRDADIIAAYAVATLANGERTFSVLTRGQIDRVRASSRAKDNGPWVDWFPAMAQKTAVKNLMKFVGVRDEHLDASIEVDTRSEDGSRHLSADVDEPQEKVGPARGNAALRGALGVSDAPVDDVEAEMIAAENANAG